jgi:hypothetical protein
LPPLPRSLQFISIFVIRSQVVLTYVVCVCILQTIADLQTGKLKMSALSGYAPKVASRSLRVSIWFSFAPAVADVSVEAETGVVKIASAWLEPKASQGRISLEAEDLDKLAVIRRDGPMTLREALEVRAREEAFA